MSKRVKLFLAAGGVLILLLLALYLKNTDSSTAGKVNALQSIGTQIEDKTFQTKLEAYDAMANEKESFYNRPASAFKQAVKMPAQATLEVLPVQGGGASSVKDENRQFDKAYAQVEENVRSIYEQEGTDAHKQQKSNTVSQVDIQQETSDERRRRAMIQDWGMGNKEVVPESEGSPSTYRAVIHGTQLVKVGQTALFRTKEQIHYNNIVVPANTLLSGQAMVSQNRLNIKISSVRINNEVFALPLEVYGSDGIPGIPINYDEAGQIANSHASNTTVQEVGSAVSRYGGTIGRIAGSLVTGVGSQVRSAKSVEIKLIDNQSVILKISQQ